ncbi:hypothetical protein IW261DRAFT_252607 [Armillaria novae-zelandiae]|uniref:Uncharacterized protein n=1 Tax=Armillaria novae-zelandiae TaxID=153914 RepID=A0AA39UGF0_9AGAR|nr:hypothetical protein IW261DRAFT_252607 [Armillaria novae-zelandiae]
MPPHQRQSRVLCCFTTSLSFFILFPIMWLVFTFVLGLKVDGSSEDLKNANRSIILQPRLVSADIPQATMLLEWSVSESQPCSSSQNINCSVFDIFLIINLSPSDARYNNGPYGNSTSLDPIFTWNSTHIWDTFRTELTLVSSSGALFFYPFDYYGTTIMAFAQNMSTKVPVGVSLNISPEPISGLNTETTFAPTYTDQCNIADIPPGLVTCITFTLQRTTSVIAYCLIITVTFWMVTLMICLIMIATVFFGFRQRNEVVVVPIGTVFAFTQLRSSMPGAPEGFGGVLDIAGLLPCLVLLSISSITMIGMYLLENPDDPSRKVLTWSVLKDSISYCFRCSSNTAKEWVQRVKFGIMIARQIYRERENFEIHLTNIV